MTFFLLFLVVGLVALGWLVWQQQRAVFLMSEQLTEAHHQVTQLSNQLTDAETTMSVTAQDTDQMIATNESEIRKLWDVSNKRNKAWIQTNQADIGNVEKGVTQLKQTLTQVETDVNTSLNSLVVQQRNLTDKLNLLTQQNNQLTDKLSQQVTRNADLLQAIDMSRQQNNQRILDAANRISNLEQRVTSVEDTRAGL